MLKELYMSELRRINKKEHKKKNKGDLNPGLCDIVTEQSLEKNYKILGKVIFHCGSNRKIMDLLFKGKGIERLLVKGKKDQLDEVDGHPFDYYLLAGIIIYCMYYCQAPTELPTPCPLQVN